MRELRCTLQNCTCKLVELQFKDYQSLQILERPRHHSLQLVTVQTQALKVVKESQCNWENACRVSQSVDMMSSLVSQTIHRQTDILPTRLFELKLSWTRDVMQPMLSDRCPKQGVVRSGQGQG